MTGFFLLPVLILAVWYDLRKKKIPNPLIVSALILGSAYQWSREGPQGMISFAGGALIPFFLLAPLHYYRMLGAGDIKLFMAVGGFLGAAESLKCMCLTFFVAAIFSGIRIFRDKSLLQRFQYFFRYIEACGKNKKWTPYIRREETKAYLHLSIPMALSVLLIQGGIF